MTFKTALKAVEKNSENMGSRLYNFLIMQNIKNNMNFMRGFMDLKQTNKQKNKGTCTNEPARQKDIRQVDF